MSPSRNCHLASRESAGNLQSLLDDAPARTGNPTLAAVTHFQQVILSILWKVLGKMMMA
jgi:hypothetical protein